MIVCAANPTQIVEIYKTFFSISALKNIVSNADQINTIMSTGGILSVCASSTAIRVGILDKCSKMIDSHPRVWALILPRCSLIKETVTSGAFFQRIDKRHDFPYL